MGITILAEKTTQVRFDLGEMIWNTEFLRDLLDGDLTEPNILLMENTLLRLADQVSLAKAVSLVIT